MDTRTAQGILSSHGFPCVVDGVQGPITTAQIRRFQEAWNRAQITVDGVLGPETARVLERFNLDGLLSDHFAWTEMRSHGDGTCYIRRELLAALESLRAHIGRAVPVLSGYRDTAYNRSVGGAVDSMHRFGLAADIRDARVTVGEVQALELFAGIGDHNGIVWHVDCRQNAGSNNHTPDATVKTPARWHY